MNTYIVQLKLPYTSTAATLVVLAQGETPDEALEMAESAWGYEALAIARLPKLEPSKRRSNVGRHLYPVTSRTEVVETKVYDIPERAML